MAVVRGEWAVLLEYNEEIKKDKDDKGDEAKKQD